MFYLCIKGLGTCSSHRVGQKHLDISAHVVWISLNGILHGTQILHFQNDAGHYPEGK